MTAAAADEQDEPETTTPPVEQQVESKPASKASSSPEAKAETKPASAASSEAKAEAKPKAPAKKKAPAKATAKKAAPADEAPSDDESATEEAAESATEEAAATTATKERPRRPGTPAKPLRRRLVRARARHVRTSARKARMVCSHLRGKTVSEARAILAFTPREVARDWSKLLESAIANAENNHELLEDDLVVHEAYADEGPTIKRFRPRAMGRATPIHKRTSHLTITLTPGD